METSARAGRTRLSETDYVAGFQQIVLPFWKAGVTNFVTGKDGLRLHTWHRRHPAARARIFIAHGYAENTLKYRELAHDFYQQGYSVFVWDHRGHGWSDRVGAQKHNVDVLRFSDYADDMLQLMEATPRDPGLPTFVFAHSMGGAITLDFMQRHPRHVQAAVLSSPMLAPQLQGLPVSLVTWLAKGLARFHAPDRCSVRSEATAEHFWTFSRAGTRSRARFDLFKKDTLEAGLRLAGPTNRWVITAFETAAGLLAAERMACLSTPLFVATAGHDHLVRADAIQRFCALAPAAESRLFPESFHEIWNERDHIRNPYLDEVLTFFQRMESI